MSDNKPDSTPLKKTASAARQTITEQAKNAHADIVKAVQQSGEKQN